MNDIEENDDYRICSCCGKKMQEGYVDCDNYYCSDRCLIWGNTPDGLSIKPNEFYTMKKWAKDYEENPDDCYYTEWYE